MDDRNVKRPATAEDAGRDTGPDPAALLEYVGDMCRELADMARKGGHGRLAAALDLASNEARGGITH